MEVLQAETSPIGPSRKMAKVMGGAIDLELPQKHCLPEPEQIRESQILKKCSLRTRCWLCEKSLTELAVLEITPNDLNLNALREFRCRIIKLREP